MSATDEPRITVTEHGPYMLEGGVEVRDARGETVSDGDKAFLCRCGHSSNKPFCDGTHNRIGFDGTETASRKPYLHQAKEIDGPALILGDAEELCAHARFCDRAGGIWKLTRQSDDPKARRIAIEEAGDCPSGRLVVREKTGEAIEPEFEPSIALVEDPQEGVSGPIWVRGNIPVQSADGTPYEIRNRVTLCRCGRSSNKPFCDGSHRQR